MSTENIAYEKRYRNWRAQYDAIFAPENRNLSLDNMKFQSKFRKEASTCVNLGRNPEQIGE